VPNRDVCGCFHANESTRYSASLARWKGVGKWISVPA
jgi:hypothetical protein